MEYNIFLASRKTDHTLLGLNLNLRTLLRTPLFPVTVCFTKFVVALDSLLFSVEVLHSEETCFLRCVTASKSEENRNNSSFVLVVPRPNEDNFVFESCSDNYMTCTKKKNGARTATKYFLYKQKLYYFITVTVK